MLGSWQAEDVSKCGIYEMCSVTELVRAVVGSWNAYVLQCSNIRDTLACGNMYEMFYSAEI
jgi:hypothetical protein